MYNSSSINMEVEEKNMQGAVQKLRNALGGRGGYGKVL